MRKEGKKSKNSKSHLESYTYDDLPSYKSYEELRSEVLVSTGSYKKALILKHNLNLIDTDEQKKVAIEFVNDCIANEDGSARREIAALQKQLRELNTMKSGNWTIYFKDPKIVNPALDILPDGTLIATAPFISEWVVTDRKGNTKIRKELANSVITSNLEVFPCTDSEFARREIFAKIPETVLRSR